MAKGCTKNEMPGQVESKEMRDYTGQYWEKSSLQFSQRYCVTQSHYMCMKTVKDHSMKTNTEGLATVRAWIASEADRADIRSQMKLANSNAADYTRKKLGDGK